MTATVSEYKIRWEFETAGLTTMEELLSYAKVLMWDAEEAILGEKIEKVSASALKLFDPKFSFNVILSESDWQQRGVVEIIMFLNSVDSTAKNSASLSLARRRVINRFSALEKKQ